MANDAPKLKPSHRKLNRISGMRFASKKTIRRKSLEVVPEWHGMFRSGKLPEQILDRYVAASDKLCDPRHEARELWETMALRISTSARTRGTQVIVKIYGHKQTLGQAAAEHAAARLRIAICELGSARIIAATGTSQLEFLEALTAAPGISWQNVELFHLDEYIGLSCAHPASFRRYLLDRLIGKVGIGKYHLLDGEGQPAEVIRRTGSALQSREVDLAFVGIGENGHLAFNDPPADFETEEPFLVVELDEACRRQQVGEGWFRDVAEVPRRAISMSIRQILKAREILAIVPDVRKAQAVKACCEGAVSPLAPASILQRHPYTTLFLDRDSARLLSAKTTARL